MITVSRDEFFAVVNPLNVHPRAERMYSEWIDQRTYAVVGRSYPGYLCEGEVRYELAEAYANRCHTCGAAIDEAQAGLSRLRADGALPRCKDCITKELTEQLISDAARAVEEIDPDELERYAAERRRTNG